MPLHDLARICAASFLCLCTAPATFAQVTEGTTGSNAIIRSEDGTTTVYPASYFDQFSPLSLNDMLQRIPGASIGEFVANEERRGLRGNEDSILINGQQVTGKDSGGSSALNNIAANQVDRIEIIRGSSSEVQSSTQRIINVILLETSGDTLTMTFALPTYVGDGSVRPVVALTYAVTEANRNYAFAFNTMPIYRPWERLKISSDLTGLPILSSVESEQADRYSANATGRYDQRFSGGSRLQLNGLIKWNDNDRERREVVRDLLLPPGLNQLSDSLEDDHRDRYTAEISADYSFPLSPISALTVLGVYNWQEDNRQRDVLDLEPVGDLVTAREDRLETKTESIVRGTYDRILSDTFGFQIGAEGTINTQNTEFDFLTLVDGALQPLAIFNSDGTVKEYRGEGFSTLRWNVSESVQAEFGIAFEASRITQNSADVDSGRSLSFVKPTFNVYWDATSRNKLFFAIQRDVDQLNFRDFVTNITQMEQEVEAGNPDLRPVRSWDYELGMEHRLADGGGLLSGTLFYRDVQDVRGRTTFNGLISQISNIGDGQEYGIDTEASIDFTRLGWWDGVLTATYLRRISKVEDPFDGVRRRFGFTPNWETSVQYRHEIKTLINGHVSFNYSQLGARFINDIENIDRFKESGSLTISIEHNVTNNVRINLSSNNFLNLKSVKARRSLALNPGGPRQLTGTRLERAKWGRIFNLYVRVQI
ncbi:MAG: outer membrane beta-barrel protein [Rhodospirillaceae bacterium]|jgi:outer membrane receptor protein involved in Fe transport|nr:outer membrane beta-barrel protein [Rhodospirillaceae bacterium]